MDSFSYKTIKFDSAGIFKEKGSKFLAFAFPVASESEVKEKLELLRKKYFDARHHCYAYILGEQDRRFRANDDGEPNHSAGDPILGQIRSKQLTNVLVVVVRYFGGTKLGVSGLISAYKTATENALINSQFVERELTGSITFRFDYSSTSDIMKLVNDHGMIVLEKDFGVDTKLTLSYLLRNEEELLKKIELFRALGKVKAER